VWARIDMRARVCWNCYTDLPDERDGAPPSPVPNHLFRMDDNQRKVDEKKAQFFHTYVAKILFLCKWARPNLQTAVAFLYVQGSKHVTRMITRSSSGCYRTNALRRMTI
jgi:hypothetical protein